MRLIYSYLMIAGSLLVLSCTQTKKSVKVELRSAPWSFPENATPTSLLSGQNTDAAFRIASDSTSFTIRFTLSLEDLLQPDTLLHIPDILSVHVYQADRKDRKGQNYPGFPMPDGTVPVLEASLRLHPLPGSTESNIRDMPIGIPLALLPDSSQPHEVILHFSGVEWTLYIDNELMDNEFALGYPHWGPQNFWTINPERVLQATIFAPGLALQKQPLATPRIAKDIQYWTPTGHNTWVGDVATFFHEGRYHIFYLFDRRGHASKFGRGGHYFEHLSTADFHTWTEHEAATPIESQWETLGTGTPFIMDGKLCISYGLHTTRIYPRAQTTLPQLWDYYHTHGVTGSFNYDTLSAYPAGATYAVSANGISDFKKTHILFHPSENPSVYTDHKGRLRMLANYGTKGTWESQSVDGGWSAVDSTFPPGGDCTFFFHWGDYDYVIGGFTGLWSKPTDAPEGSYVDVVQQGFDFYNGMSVPAVTEINDGRFLLAGWIPIASWGGTLNIHEMIQFPDGRIGTKWMEEIIPATEKVTLLTEEIVNETTFETENESFLLTFEVDPGDNQSGKLGALFLGADGDENACEFQLSPHAKTAQYGNGSLTGFSMPEKSLREGGSPHHARHYGVENLFDTDRPFTVRIFVKYDPKYGGSQIDTEIAGKRTMITFCPELKVDKLLFRTAATGIKNVNISPYRP